jgi:hypothetical protein
MATGLLATLGLKGRGAKGDSGQASTGDAGSGGARPPPVLAKGPMPPPKANGTVADPEAAKLKAAADAAHAELRRQIGDATKLLASLTDRNKKAELGTELAALDTERQANHKNPDLAEVARLHTEMVAKVKDVMARGGEAVQAAADERKRAEAEKQLTPIAKGIDTALGKIVTEVEAQTVAGLKQTLKTELDALSEEKKQIDALGAIEALPRAKALDTKVRELLLRSARLRKEAADAQKLLDDKAGKPLAALDTLLKGQVDEIKSVFQAQATKLETDFEVAQALLDKGDIAAMKTAVPKLANGCQDLTKGINGYAAEFPAYNDLRGGVVSMIERMKGSGMLDADGDKAIGELEAAVSAADTLGPIRGYAAARDALNRVIATAKKLRDNNKAYTDFAAERDKVAKKVKDLKAHAQAGKLKAEIAHLDKELVTAAQLAKRPDGGALKALTALKTIDAECANHTALADKLVAAEAQLPELKTKLEASGVKKEKVEETARFALKALVEENCTQDEAVDMAKDASGYKDEGMEEQDAIMSSRVKKSLVDSGLEGEHARSIGRSVRAGGTATADDAKALAQAMKGVSKKAIDTLNKAGIKSECCRGPITDAMPDLAGVKPRGWPETSSWDEVPGVYNPSEKKLVVGTMDDGGKRKVPEPGEGPLPHGASDLYGHEAGHAFDAANPGGKSGNTAFLKARSDDIKDGSMVGGAAGGVDDYFMTSTEGGANDAGATSETFAESFAMHFSAAPKRWPKLEAFWGANPWGV